MEFPPLSVLCAPKEYKQLMVLNTCRTIRKPQCPSTLFSAPSVPPRFIAGAVLSFELVEPEVVFPGTFNIINTGIISINGLRSSSNCRSQHRNTNKRDNTARATTLRLMQIQEAISVHKEDKQAFSKTMTSFLFKARSFSRMRCHCDMPGTATHLKQVMTRIKKGHAFKRPSSDNVYSNTLLLSELVKKHLGVNAQFRWILNNCTVAGH